VLYKDNYIVGGNSIILDGCFNPILADMIQFDLNIAFKGVGEKTTN